MRNNKDLPKCGLRADGKCQHNMDRCGKKESAELIGKYGLPYWGWRRFPFFSPQDCWDQISRPNFIVVKFKNTKEKRITRPSKCPRCWALDSDTGDIYKYEERPTHGHIEYVRTGEVI